jgi:hypothetical protein
MFTNRNEQREPRPIITASEHVWEPKLSIEASLAFLRNLKGSLERSEESWCARYHLERMRQGNFRSLEECITNGWRQLVVTINSADLKVIETLSLDMAQEKGASGYKSSTGGGFMSWFGLGGSSTPPPRVGSARRRSSSGVLGGSNEKAVISPSSFVEIDMVSDDKTYYRAIGRTNTEYVNDHPDYGSNINKNAAARPSINFTPAKGVSLLYEDSEYTSPTGNYTDEGEIEMKDVVGTSTSFSLYIPPKDGLKLRFKV